jgi:hypothetical protein
MGQLNLTVRQLKKVVALKPDFPEALYTLAVILNNDPQSDLYDPVAASEFGQKALAFSLASNKNELAQTIRKFLNDKK